MKTRVPEPHLTAWRAVLKLQASIVAAVEDALVVAELPPMSWYDVLLPLHEAKAPMRMGELGGAVLTIGRTGLTRLVDRLEGAGLLTRAPAKGDRRGVDVAITADGSSLLRRMWPVYAKVLRERFVAPLGDDDARRLLALVERVNR